MQLLKLVEFNTIDEMKDKVKIDDPNEYLTIDIYLIRNITVRFFMALLEERCKNSYSAEYFMNNMELINANSVIKQRFKKACSTLIKSRSKFDNDLRRNTNGNH